MLAYGFGFLSLIHHLQELFLDVHQPWYAFDSANGYSFNNIQWLTFQVPSRNYFPEPENLILVIGEHKLRRAKELFSNLNSNFVSKTNT